MKRNAEMVPITGRKREQDWNQMERRIEMVPIREKEEWQKY